MAQTTDDRIAEIDRDIDDMRYCDEDEARWLISELRRAREALRELNYETSSHPSISLAGWVSSVAKRGLGE